MTIQDVIDGRRTWAAVQANNLDVLRQVPQGTFDLVFGSPPYEDARVYGELEYALKDQEWVEQIHAFFRAAVPKVKPLGLVALVVGHGKTRDYKWSATPALLMADLHRAGFNLRCPPLYERIGIFGSGGKDYWRYDYEFVVVVQNGRGRIPWANNTACGHPPLWGPGGAASHRMTDGARVNQWGGRSSGSEHRKRARVKKGQKPSHVMERVGVCHRKPDGSREVSQYNPPAIANPGNVIAPAKYTAEEVEAMMAWYEDSLIAHCVVGGNNLGNKLAHLNEAPFPLGLAERFVLTFCPPGGIVFEPYLGSGTTLEASVANGRRAAGCDLRADQVELTRRRMAGVTPALVVQSDEEFKRRVAAKEAAKPPGPVEAGGPPPGLFDRLAGDPAGDP